MRVESFPPLVSFKTESHVAQAHMEFPKYLRMTLNSQSSYIHLCAGIPDVYHHFGLFLAGMEPRACCMLATEPLHHLRPTPAYWRQLLLFYHLQLQVGKLRLERKSNVCREGQAPLRLSGVFLNCLDLSWT